ncbi:reverse transcriptase domain-containing protein [Tanacetum coccineum]
MTQEKEATPADTKQLKEDKLMLVKFNIENESTRILALTPDITFLPISGLRCTNIQTRVERDVCSWFYGQCIFKALDGVEVAPLDPNGPFRNKVSANKGSSSSREFDKAKKVDRSSSLPNSSRHDYGNNGLAKVVHPPGSTAASSGRSFLTEHNQTSNVETGAVTHRTLPGSVPGQDVASLSIQRIDGVSLCRHGYAVSSLLDTAYSSKPGNGLLVHQVLDTAYASRMIRRIGCQNQLRKENEEAQQRKFLENLKQLHINIPFTEALEQMPNYTKFLKGLLSNKTRLDEACTVTMNERCSAVLLNKLLSKEKDPGSFTIPCDIRHLHTDNALADLGASISLISYMMYEKLGLGEPKPTRMSLELADRSIQYPQGIEEDVLPNPNRTIRSREENFYLSLWDFCLQEDAVRIMQRPDNFSKVHDDKMLGRCEETNLVLNWKKCHFMVKEGIVLGHKISGKGSEVDKAKIDVIAKLPYPQM